MREIKIGSHCISLDSPPIVIAELGGMYDSLNGIKKLMAQSVKAGADIVKIQTYKAETICLPNAEFEMEDGKRISQYDFFKKYEISDDDHLSLMKYAEELGVPLISTPSYYDDVDFLESCGVCAYKTGSDDLTNYPFLKYIAEKGKPVIISTGMATLAEVELAVETILGTGNDQLILLHCTVSYPPDPEYANLNVIRTLRDAFQLPVGYSDHVFGVYSSVLAASMGACVVEKHVTLDRSRKLPDYQVCLEPAELKQMVDMIRIEPVLKGSSVKCVYPPEEKWRRNARKSLVATRDLSAGDVLHEDDVKLIRPGTGIHPKDLSMCIGRTLKCSVGKNEIIPRNAL